MSEFVTWVPQHDGHAPPRWRKGMVWATKSTGNICPTSGTIEPSWYRNLDYVIPASATNGPFDADAWLAQGLANLDNLPEGVTLPSQRDWADDLATIALSAYCQDEASLANFLRTRCQPKNGKGY